MNKVAITVALFALLGTVTVSCQKETETIPSSDWSQVAYNVRYSIDNHIYYACLQSPEEWHTFLSDMLALSRKHHRITIHKLCNNCIIASKEKEVFQTSDKGEAEAWAEKMMLAGYDIIFEFDDETGNYIITAIRE